MYVNIQLRNFLSCSHGCTRFRFGDTIGYNRSPTPSTGSGHPHMPGPSVAGLSVPASLRFPATATRPARLQRSWLTGCKQPPWCPPYQRVCLCVPASAGSSLSPARRFFHTPCVSGCILTAVESREYTSVLVSPAATSAASPVVAGPAVQPHRDGMTMTETLRQGPPCAAVFAAVDQGIEQYTIFNVNIPPLYR